MISEATVTNQILKWLNAQPGCRAEKRWGGGIYTQGGRPDITGCFRGRRFEFEVKVGKNKPTKLQERELRLWKEAGAVTAVVYSLDDVKEIFDNELNDRTTFVHEGDGLVCNKCRYEWPLDDRDAPNWCPQCGREVVQDIEGG